jgi:ribosomal-protein-alanine N-acetyltransferase
MRPKIEPLTTDQVRDFLQWQYSGPYAMYNMSAEDEETQILFFLDPQNGYFAITDNEGTLLGFCNFGADARVPGGDYSVEAIDIGMGMRPDLTGQGNGKLYAGAVFDFAKIQYAGQQHRVTIAEFNQRAQQLCRKVGFKQVERFLREKDGRPFVVMIRDLKR